MNAFVRSYHQHRPHLSGAVTTDTGRRCLRKAALALGLGMALLNLAGTARAQSQNAPNEAHALASVHWQGSISPKVKTLLDAQTLPSAATMLDHAQLDALTQQLTKTLREKGYVVALVLVTPADRAAFFQTGELRLTVLEGHVGAVTLNNSSRVNDDRLARLATEALCPDGVGDACPLTAKHLERAQLLLQDEPGVSVAPTALSPEGVAVGQTSVNLTTTSSIPLVSGYAGIDNYGIPASGMNRLGAGVVLTDLLHAGDVFSASGIFTNRHEDTYLLSGSIPLFNSGLRAQGGYSHTLYSLARVGASGTADTYSGGVSYPLWRGLDRNWSIAFDGLDTTSQQTVAGFEAFAPRHIASGRVTLSANAGDRPMELGNSYWSGALSWQHGQVSQDMQGRDVAGELGRFDKLAFNALGKLNLTADHRWYLLGNLHSQWASRNLDASEAMQIGGQPGVRAYRADEGSLDSGVLASVELRRLFTLPNGDHVALGPIVDYGNGRINQHPFTGWQVVNGYSDPTLSNHRVLSSAGLGADWVSTKGYTASVTWSSRLPGSPDSVNYPGSAHSRFFASVTFKF